MKKIDFKTFLSYAKKEMIIVPRLEGSKPLDPNRAVMLWAKDEADLEAKQNQVDFYSGIYFYMLEYPNCEKLLTDACAEYDRTGRHFNIGHNFIELEDGEKADVLPLVIIWE